MPVNYLTGPGRFDLNLRISKSFGFGKKSEPNNTGNQGPGAGGVFGRGPGGPGGGGHGGGGGGGGGRGGGPDAGSTGHKYNLTFSVAGRNIENNVNLATPIGNLSSPLFGESNGIVTGFGGGGGGGGAAPTTSNSKIDLQVSFNF